MSLSELGVLIWKMLTTDSTEEGKQTKQHHSSDTSAHFIHCDQTGTWEDWLPGAPESGFPWPTRVLGPNLASSHPNPYLEPYRITVAWEGCCFMNSQKRPG